MCISAPLRNPSIKFRYGSREQHQKTEIESMQSSLALENANPYAVQASEPISDYELPLKFRRVPMEDVEIDYINRGGPE
mgnify:CR=1 FL=1